MIAVDRRHHAVGRAQKAKDAGIKVISYDRLIMKLAERRLLCDLRQLQGRRAPGPVHRARPRPRRRQGPVQHRAVRRLGRRQQRVLLLQRRHVGPAALHRQGQARRAAKQMGMDKVATLRWDAATAQARMDNLLTANYTGKKLDAVLSPYDGLAIGIISSLKSVGYGTADMPYPVISGQDCDKANVKSIIAHEQSCRSSRTRANSPRSPSMVDAVVIGQGSRRSTTPRPTTTASRSFRPTSATPCRGQEQLQGPADRHRLLQARPAPVRRVRFPLRRPAATTARGSAFYHASTGVRAYVGWSARRQINVDERHPRNAGYHQDVSRREGAGRRQSRRSKRARSTPSAARTAPANRR